jgi:hypothetical protein
VLRADLHSVSCTTSLDEKVTTFDMVFPGSFQFHCHYDLYYKVV